MKRRSAKRTVVPLLVLCAAGAAWFTGELRAPWSGLAIATVGTSLVALGFAAGVRGMLLAAAGTAALLSAWWLTFEFTLDSGVADSAADETGSSSNCDPSCGLSLGGTLILALPVAMGLAGAGIALRLAAVRLSRRSSRSGW